MSTSAITGASAASANTTGSVSANMNQATDRFLKLLVTQMQNQDPLNPMDNAQLTSQMAQINTVTGIEKLNTTMTSMSSTFTQMQMLQGASLVGRAVLLEGNKLAVNTQTGNAGGGYELASAANKVQIDIVNSAGTVVDSITQTGKSAGRQAFEWTPPAGVDASKLTFKVTALNNNTAVTATPLMTDLVNAVTTTDGALTLELANSGNTAYSKVKAIG
ncbi:MAG TPA: flagellar hook capping FlgD N-terminal domain-containing protein [Aquabacterium sp.]|nr:flagellar hook capping FlgD N-terminal domain-containing protein [Aquabacterium sp.]